MASNGKIPVELTPEQMEDLIDAATRAAEQEQEDAEILNSQPRIDRETVGMLLETRKRLLTLAAWMQHLWEEAVMYRDQNITVRAGDELAAIFTAAKYWGYKWSAPEYHQNAKAMKLHHKPELLIG